MSKTKPKDPNAIPLYFKATDLAGFCQVDLKTVHNWCDRGKIDFFRTPGNHLRFRPPEVAQFLEKYGYTVPPIVRTAAAAEAASPSPSSEASATPAGEA